MRPESSWRTAKTPPSLVRPSAWNSPSRLRGWPRSGLRCRLKLAPGTISMLTSRLKSCLFPYIGSRPIAALTAQELFFALHRIEARGRRETAHRARAVAGRVLRYAVGLITSGASKKARSLNWYEPTRQLLLYSVVTGTVVEVTKRLSLLRRRALRRLE